MSCSSQHPRSVEAATAMARQPPHRAAGGHSGRPRPPGGQGRGQAPSRTERRSWRGAAPETLCGEGGATPRRSRPEAPRDQAPHLHTKISFGVIVTRISKATNRPEAVLVRGRYSYEFAEFVHGRYSRKNSRAVSALFDAMSVNERLDIYSLDFAQMWYRIWLTSERRELYNKKFAKFQASWLRDDSGEYLRRLVQGSRPSPADGGIRLEFPKGKRQSNLEPDLNCAIRETEEEAGISKCDYQILPGIKRRASHVHMGVRYVNVYYVAVARRELTVGVDFRDLDQVSEVSEVRWMDIEQIRLFDAPDRRLEKTVAPVFKYVKRYARGLIPTRSLAFRLTPDGGMVDVNTHFDDIVSGELNKNTHSELNKKTHSEQQAALAKSQPGPRLDSPDPEEPPRRDLAARDDVAVGGAPLVAAPAGRPPPPPRCKARGPERNDGGHAPAGRSKGAHGRNRGGRKKGCSLR